KESESEAPGQALRSRSQTATRARCAPSLRPCSTSCTSSTPRRARCLPIGSNPPSTTTVESRRVEFGQLLSWTNDFRGLFPLLPGDNVGCHELLLAVAVFRCKRAPHG